MPKFPHIEVQLSGEDGNAMAIMGRVAGAMRQGGVEQIHISAFNAEAMSGDYDGVLQTAMRYVTCN